MKVRIVRLFCLITCFAIAAPIFSQAGHPLKGSWSGDWGFPGHRNRVLLLLDWDGNEISGTINPGPNAIAIETAELDPSTWTLTLEAMVPLQGELTRYFMEGTVENLGSWTNRTITGTWRHGETNGDFRVVLN